MLLWNVTGNEAILTRRKVERQFRSHDDSLRAGNFGNKRRLFAPAFTQLAFLILQCVGIGEG